MHSDLVVRQLASGVIMEIITALIITVIKEERGMKPTTVFRNIPESATKTLRRTERRRERATEKKLLAFDVEWYLNHKSEAWEDAWTTMN